MLQFNTKNKPKMNGKTLKSKFYVLFLCQRIQVFLLHTTVVLRKKQVYHKGHTCFQTKILKPYILSYLYSLFFASQLPLKMCFSCTQLLRKLFLFWDILNIFFFIVTICVFFSLSFFFSLCHLIVKFVFMAILIGKNNKLLLKIIKIKITKKVINLELI